MTVTLPLPGHSNRPIGAARDLRKRVRKSQNRVKFAAGGFGCFARLALYSSTAFNTGPITHSYCAPMLYSSRGSDSILNILGGPFIGAALPPLPAKRSAPPHPL